jgi:hypothetical protein
MSELHVGREMDAAVAEAVGLVCREIHAPEWGFNVPTPCWIVKDTTKPFDWGCVRVENWHPSTSIADAFAALDAMMAERPGQWPQLSKSPATNQWRCEIGFSMHIAEGYGATPAEAICRAILALAEATT